jgi:hypothetical protein
VIVLIMALAVFLLVEQMQIRQTLLRWLRQGLAVLKQLGEGFVQAVEGIARSITLSDLVGYVLLLTAFALVLWRVRRRLMGTPRFTMPRCPACGGELLRVRRRWRDRLVDLYVPVRRFRCKASDCHWGGLRIGRFRYKTRRTPRRR